MSTESAPQPEWYFRVHRRRQGPLTAAQMRQLLLEGTIRPDTLVWAPNFGRDWQVLRNTVLWDAQSMSSAGEPPQPSASQDGSQSAGVAERRDDPDARSKASVSRLPSATFMLLLAVCIASGAALFVGVKYAFLPFIFVLSAWVVSLCLHEFGHAIAALAGGDRSVVSSGYLTLDPFKYMDPFLSLVLPAIFVVIGGLAFPGGAVRINTRALRGRIWDSAVSAAGPAMTALVMVLFGLIVSLGVRSEFGTDAFYFAAAFICFLQATALILNMLPIPGLDGFGIIRPYLPPAVQRQSMKIAGIGAMLILMAIFFVPGGSDWIVGAGRALAAWIGVPTVFIIRGYRDFAFWL